MPAPLSLRLFIEQYASLPEEDWKKIALLFHPRTVQAGQLLLAEGQICRHLYFLESGLLRYFILKDGSEITKFFTDAPYVFTSQVSFTTQAPAKESIEALEDGTLWEISLADANALLAHASWSTFVRKLIQEVQKYTEEILTELQTTTAEDRYKKMLSSQPQLLNRIPLKHVASYFGIAPQSLSRIRKNMLASRS